jgi:ribosomal protein L2
MRKGALALVACTSGRSRDILTLVRLLNGDLLCESKVVPLSVGNLMQLFAEQSY